MSNDEYQQQKNWTPISEPIVVEKDENGNPLMSIQLVLLDFTLPKQDGKNPL